MPLKDQEAYCTAQFQLAGSQHTSVITCGLSNFAGESANAVELAWRTALAATGRPFELSNILVGWTFAKTTALVNNAGVETYFETVINAAGTKVGQGVPTNGAVLVQKNTGIVGRKYRGRMYVPPFYFIEGDVDMAGVINSTPLTAYRALWAATFTELAADLHEPCILHLDTAEARTLCTSLTVSNLLASQRRRMRR